jgi:hypothetical protein
MKQLFLTIKIVCIFIYGYAQVEYNYGTQTSFLAITDGNSGTSPSIFNPQPAQGTFFYGITSSSGGELTGANPGLASLGTETEAVGKAASGTGNSDYAKFGIQDFSSGNPKTGYFRFEVVLAGNTGYNSSSSGYWYFCAGDGRNNQFMDDNHNQAFDIRRMACVIQWKFISNDEIEVYYYDYTQASYVLLGYYEQATRYLFEIYVNGLTSTNMTYERGGYSFTLFTENMDIWIDNVLVGNNKPMSQQIHGNSNLNKISSFCFWGNSSNNAYLYTDKVTAVDSIPLANPKNFYSKSSGNLEILSTWGDNTDGSGLNPSNFTDNMQNFYIHNNTSPTIGAAWTVSGTGSKVILGDSITNIDFTVPISYVFSGDLDIRNKGTLTLENTTSPTFNLLEDGSTVYYKYAGAQEIDYDPYYHLKTGGTGTKTMDNHVTVEGDLTVGDGSNTGVMSIGSNILTLEGDLTVNSNGSITGGSSSNIVVEEDASALSLPAITSGLDTLTNKRTTGLNIAGDVSAAFVQNESGGLLYINEGKTLTVTNTLSNDNASSTSNLVLKSSATGTGNLISSTTGIYGTVQRYLLGDATNKPYHYISSPISGGSFNDIWTSGDYNVYWYDESVVDVDLDVGWTRILSGSLVNGRGYAIVSNYVDRTLNMDGVLNAATVSPTVSYTATTGTYPNGDPQGWNLIGNPFPCAILASSFISDNTSDLDASYQAVYYWDDANGDITRTADYSTRTSSSFATGSGAGSGDPGVNIPVGQGFFVKVKSGVTSLDFNASQKAANSSAQFFTPEHQTNIWLAVKGQEGLYNEIAITFSPDATKAHDPYYDAVKLRGNPFIALYSFVEGCSDQYVIQGRPYFDEDDVIPLGLFVAEEGDYQFSIKDKEGFPENTQIFLEDLYTGKITNLSVEKEHAVYLSKGEYNSRFVMHFMKSISTDVEEVAGHLDVFAYKSTIYIPEGFNGPVSVYSPDGKLLKSTIAHSSSCMSIDLPSYEGVAIIVINQNAFTKKLFLSK